MKIALLQPDAPGEASAPVAAAAPDAGSFARALDAAGALLGEAQRAEDAFAHGAGSLQRAVYDRARADVAISVAAAAAQRTAQALQSIFNLQV
jgi:hypothetical protein